MLDVERVRLLRLQRRWSQRELATRIGKDQSWVSKLERGEIIDITVTTLVRLADALGVSVDSLVRRGPPTTLPPAEPSERLPAAVA